MVDCIPGRYSLSTPLMPIEEAPPNAAKKRIRILLLEDNPKDAHVIRSMLRKSAFEITSTERLSDALETLKSTEIDEILLDLGLPDSQGLETLRRVVKQTRSIPIVVMTGHDDERTALLAVAEGAEDYLVKGKPDAETLARVLRYALERKLAEQRRLKSEERMRAILETALDAVVGMNAEGFLTGWNRRAEEIFGRRRDEVLGKPLVDLIIPEHLREQHRRYLATGEAPFLNKRMELTALRRDGTEFPVGLTVTAFVEDGVTAFTAFIADLSDRRRADVERFTMEIGMIDREATVLYASPSINRILGYEVDEVVGVTLLSLIHPDDLDLARESFDSCLTGDPQSLVRELRYRHKDGTWRYLYMVRCTQLVNPAARGIVVKYRDVTESRLARESLDDLRRQYELILDSIADGVHGIDRDGRITFENLAAARLLGWDPTELIGRLSHETLHHSRSDGSVNPKGDCPIRRTRSDGVLRHVTDDLFWRKDGTSFPTEYTCSPMFDTTGQLVGAVITFRDITKQKEMERQIEQSSRVESLGRVAATITHEFNNVLMGIQPFAEVLQRKVGEDGTLQKPITQILAATKRGRRITDQILRFTNPAEPRMEIIELVSWMRHFSEEAHLLLPDRRVEIVLGSALAVRADPAQLHQVMSNLVANARDATSAGSEVTLGVTRADEVAFLRDRLPEPERFAAFFVRDRGKGIPPAVLERIFEPLFTTKRSGGTGLGLAVTHQIVTHHGGSILVDSEPGAGTSFYVALALAQPS